MSVTLMRQKNGKSVPIRLSIWDAFKGAPLPKPRPHKCSFCNNFHAPGRQVAAPAEATPKNPAIEGNDHKPAADAVIPANQTPDFTPEEDAIILESKQGGGNVSWAQIMQKLGTDRNVDDVKARWKQIRPVENKTNTEESGKEGDETKKEEEVKSSHKQGKKQKNKAKHGNDADATVEKKPEIEAKPSHTSTNDKRKWEKAASKHFDRTGHRITADQARKMVEGST